MRLPTLHLIAPFYSTITEEWRHDGFTERARAFSKMMQGRGYEVVEYGAEGSTSEAAEKVSVLSLEKHRRLFPKMSQKDTRPTVATAGQGWHAFNYNLIGELTNRVESGDLICHVFGDVHKGAVQSLPNNSHVEIGVGYSSGPFGAWRIFDSQAWRHFHWGRDDGKGVRDEKGCNKIYSWVIPNPHDPDDWPIGNGSDDTIVYFGRMDGDKGMPIIVDLIREHAKMVNEGLVKPMRFVFAGHGDFDQQIDRPVRAAPNPLHKPNGVEVTYAGTPSPEVCASLIGGARCVLAPTMYVEPLHNCSLQSMMCGTPVISSDFGCFTETVEHGVDGLRCVTLGDWIAAIEVSKRLSRPVIRHRAIRRFSVEHCGRLYDEAFRMLSDLNGPGWKSRESHRIQNLSPEDQQLEHPDESLEVQSEGGQGS